MQRIRSGRTFIKLSTEVIREVLRVGAEIKARIKGILASSAMFNLYEYNILFIM